MPAFAANVVRNCSKPDDVLLEDAKRRVAAVGRQRRRLHGVLRSVRVLISEQKLARRHHRLIVGNGTLARRRAVDRGLRDVVVVPEVDEVVGQRLRVVRRQLGHAAGERRAQSRRHLLEHGRVLVHPQVEHDVHACTVGEPADPVGRRALAHVADRRRRSRRWSLRAGTPDRRWRARRRSRPNAASPVQVIPMLTKHSGFCRPARGRRDPAARRRCRPPGAR